MPAGSEGALVAKNMVASTTSTAWGRVRGMPISSATIQPQTPRQTHVARLTSTEASSRFLCRSSSAIEFAKEAITFTRLRSEGPPPLLARTITSSSRSRENISAPAA